MNDRDWSVFCERHGLKDEPMIHERALHRAGFKSVSDLCGEELFEDPEDPVSEGGVWVGRCEALRRIRVRVLQAKHGFGPLYEKPQNHDPFGGI